MTTTSEPIDIGQVIKQSGVPASTLHVWERAGLIESTGRNGLRRHYDPSVMTRISLIIVSQRAGFTLNEIAELFSPLAFSDGKELLETKLLELRTRRAELDRAIDGIEHAIACRASSPLACPEFLATLPSVLPARKAPNRISD